MIRPATSDDIDEIQMVRRAVRENRLSDPSKVTDADVLHYLTQRGMGWVYQADGKVVGFAIADLQDYSVWALFLLPEYEGQGIGTKLHSTMMDTYFSKTDHPCWLSTDGGTRAEQFYRMAGWLPISLLDNGEIKFEITKERWQSFSQP